MLFEKGFIKPQNKMNMSDYDVRIDKIKKVSNNAHLSLILLSFFTS